MTKKFLLVLLLLSIIGGIHAEPVFYAVKMKSSEIIEMRGALVWKIDSSRSYELQAGVLRETIATYFEPGSEYVCIMTITEYYKVATDWYASSNSMEVKIRSYGRGGKINGWTNVTEGGYEMSAPGGNATQVYKVNETTRKKISAETNYEFSNAHDADRRWKSYLNFNTNRGLVQGLPGPHIPAGAVVAYTPTYAEVMTFAKTKGVTRLSMLQPSYGRYLGDLTGAKPKTGKL